MLLTLSECDSFKTNNSSPTICLTYYGYQFCLTYERLLLGVEKYSVDLPFLSLDKAMVSEHPTVLLSCFHLKVSTHSYFPSNILTGSVCMFMRLVILEVAKEARRIPFSPRPATYKLGNNKGTTIWKEPSIQGLKE